MEQIHDRVAGLDVHRDRWRRACGRRGRAAGCTRRRTGSRRPPAGWRFGWVAGRAGGRPGRDGGDRGVLEAGLLRARRLFELWLCNAQHVKNVPGRKTDMSDAEWLADVAAHGMVRPSFVPPPPIRELRELTRYRKTQIDVRASEIQRLEKVLQDAGIKLTSVASKVLTQSGRAMIEALIAGERDPAALAELAKGKLRPKIPELTEALRGQFGAHHAIAAARILAHLDFLDATIAALDAQIAEDRRGATQSRPAAA